VILASTFQSTLLAAIAAATAGAFLARVVSGVRQTIAPKVASVEVTGSALKTRIEASRKAALSYRKYCRAVGLAVNASVALMATITALAIPLLNKGASTYTRAGCLVALIGAGFATVASLAGSGAELLQSTDIPEALDTLDLATLQSSALSAQKVARAWFRLLALRTTAILLLGGAGLSALVLLTIGQWGLTPG
jgi:hypothetical protein